MPAWAKAEMQRMVGTWLADNSAYQSTDEPIDAYGMEWQWGIGEQSLTGRLYGLRDGAEIGTFWEFRQFWHPGENQLLLYQFGANGTVGWGPLRQTAEKENEMIQTFVGPDGHSSQVGHRTVFTSADEHVGSSFTVDADGTWTENRSYTWRRVQQ